MQVRAWDSTGGGKRTFLRAFRSFNRGAFPPGRKSTEAQLLASDVISSKRNVSKWRYQDLLTIYHFNVIPATIFRTCIVLLSTSTWPHIQILKPTFQSSKCPLKQTTAPDLPPISFCLILRNHRYCTSFTRNLLMTFCGNQFRPTQLPVLVHICLFRHPFHC
jgi:hypothetical protein